MNLFEFNLHLHEKWIVSHSCVYVSPPAPPPCWGPNEMACDSLGSQAAADQQVPKGAMRQAFSAQARVTSSQLLNSNLYSHSETWWSDHSSPFAKDWVFPGHETFSANTLEGRSPYAWHTMTHRQCENIQYSLSDLAGIWNRELHKVRVSSFCVRPKTAEVFLHCSVPYFTFNLYC